ncbi:unnamed protein product, partial [Notodromas monacha]
VVLVAIAYPSLRLLYLIDEVEGPSVTLNVLGHQWYWEYSLANIEGWSRGCYSNPPRRCLIQKRYGSRDLSERQGFHDYVFGNHKINFNQPDGFGHLESEGQEFYGFDRVRSVMDGVVLVAIAYPSLRLLYLIDEVEGPSVTLNVLGHQWYWEYSLANIEDEVEGPSVTLNVLGHQWYWEYSLANIE